MGLLNQDERQRLIDLLCKLPGLETHLAIVRTDLVATLPDALRQNIVFIDAPRDDIASIVDMVGSDAWRQLSDGSYPILIVIKNAIKRVWEAQLAVQLHEQLNTLRAKFGLPLEEIPKPKALQSSDQFMEKLYSLIELLPILKTELASIRKSFGRYLLHQKCQAAHARLISLGTPILEFTTLLEQSSDLKIINNRSSLRSTLSAFNDQTKLIKDCISCFGKKYGTVVEERQPIEERGKIQAELDILIKQCEPLSEAAKSLYNLLHAYYSGN